MDSTAWKESQRGSGGGMYCERCANLEDYLRKLVVRMREGREYYEQDGSISMIPYLGKDCADMIEKLIEGE